MIKIQKGQTFTSELSKHGQSDKGPWEFTIIKEPATEKNTKHRKEITVWTEGTPLLLEKGESICIGDISAVVYGAKKYTDNEGQTRWTDQVTVTAKLTRAGDAKLDAMVKDNPGIAVWADASDEGLPF